MRILIATGIFPPDIGGPATYSHLIAGEFIKRGHDIKVITFGSKISDSSEKEKSDVLPPVIVISRTIPKGVRHLVYFWNVLRHGYHADVIYAQDAVSAGFPAMIAARILRKRFFLKVVGDHAWEQGMQRFGVTELLDDFLAKKYGFGVELLRRVEKFVAMRASKVIVPSEYLKSVVSRWGIPQEKILVIPNAVSEHRVTLSKDEARAKLGINGFVLVSVGRLVPWKGFEMLVELMSKLTEVVPHIKLIIIGSGPQEEKLKSLSQKLKAPVVFTGAVAKDKLVSFLVATDICCLNTSYEGFSHQLIESLALGVPVITTNAGGNKEVVRDGENALVAEYNNLESWKEKILQLYENKDLREKLSQGNAHITQRYSVESMITKTENLLTIHHKLSTVT